MNNKIQNECKNKAIDILKACVTDHGLLASAEKDIDGIDGTPNKTGYPQIWARDSMVCLPGAILSGDEVLKQAAKSSLQTLADFQNEKGRIPLNVDFATKTVCKENSGGVDANTWFIVGAYFYSKLTQDREFIDSIWRNLEKAHLWLTYQDSNDCGLIEVHECANWADLYPTSFNTLYDNALWYFANVAMVDLSTDSETKKKFQKQAAKIKESINFIFWVDRGWDEKEIGTRLKSAKSNHLEWFNTICEINKIIQKPFYLSHIGFRDFGQNFDSFGNMLSILFGIASEERRTEILEYVESSGVNHPFPVKAFWPVIYPGGDNWKDYMYSRNLNLPHQYHNGGIWTMLGGWYVLALLKAGKEQEAEKQIDKLVAALKLGKKEDWEFNEYHHGLTGKPMGATHQGWSAAMFLFANAANENNQILDVFKIAEFK